MEKWTMKWYMKYGRVLKWEMCDEQNQQKVDEKWEIRHFLFTKRNFKDNPL